MVGINAYPGCPLNGCVNDITDMSQLLVKNYGFQKSEITMLTDNRATTQGIKDGLTWLLAGAKAGDRLLFHYSGHGAQMPLGGVGNYHGIDDVICPYDFDWSKEHAIGDRDFHQMFSSVPSGVEFVWVSDSCHSGNLDRDLASPLSLKTLKTIPVPVDVKWNLDAVKDRQVQALGMPKAASANNVVLIAGCRSNQTSADAYIDGRYNGALSYYLLQELQKSNGAQRPLQELIAFLQTDLEENNYDQIPQLEGAPELLKRGFLQI